MTAHVTHLRIEDRLFERTGEVASCYVFNWFVATPKDWAGCNKRAREALKQQVPAADRGWDPDGKRWFVKVEYRAVLAKLFGNFEAALESQRVLF